MFRVSKELFTKINFQTISLDYRKSAALRLVKFTTQNMSSKGTGSSSVTFTKDELKKRLTPLQYHVTQEKGTERPFTGEYEKNKVKGEYKCIVCGNLLFKSDHKYESGSGWPSFYQTAVDGAVERISDRSHGMIRVEAVCQKCKAHLGHVFDDGPNPTGERYCMNSASLSFKKSK